MRISLVLLAVLAIVGAAIAACDNAQDQGTLQILFADGGDPFVGPPAATTLDVDGIGQDGGVTPIVHGASVSTGTVDLGSLNEQDEYALAVTAYSADGGRVAFGETLPFELGAIAAEVLPVYVQRTGTLWPMPSPMEDGRNAPLLGVLAGEYVFESGGTDSAHALNNNLYDLVPWAPSPGVSFTTPPQSLALSGVEALGIAADGGTWIDFSSNDLTGATLPAGATWADVAGGQAVVADDGTVYIVGGTRQTGGATSAVLVVSTSQTLSFVNLSTARLGASAAWVNGKGLIVAGGNVSAGGDAGATGAGVEYLASGATSGTPVLSYPADPTQGGGMDAIDANDVVVVEGSKAMQLNLSSCGSPCAPTPWATRPESLTFAQVFDIDGQNVFVVGEDATGASHAVRVSQSTATEIPFKIPRNHARGVRLPMGQVAVVGGNATIESFVP